LFYKALNVYESLFLVVVPFPRFIPVPGIPMTGGTAQSRCLEWMVARYIGMVGGFATEKRGNRNHKPATYRPVGNMKPINKTQLF
jgi:hypothetical protein